jgi:hypothetical protein
MSEQPHVDWNKARHRKLLLRMAARISIYYLVLAAAVAIAVATIPGFTEQLPLGGVGQFADYSSSGGYDLEQALVTADDEELEDVVNEAKRSRLESGPPWLRDAASLFYAMFSTLVLMLPVSWVYRAIHTDSIYDHSIDTTTLVLPAVVAGIVTVVQHSLALAFSLAGIVAGVRFRRALNDTFDTLFILASIGVGIAAGIKSLEIAVVLTVFFNYAAIGVCAFGDGLESQHLLQEEIRRKQAKAAKARQKMARAQSSDSKTSL